MEQEHPKSLLRKVTDALGITDEAPDASDRDPAVPAESEIAFERDLGGAPTEGSMKIIRETDPERLRHAAEYPGEKSALELNSQSERLRREVDEDPREKSALELNAQSARREDGE